MNILFRFLIDIDFDSLLGGMDIFGMVLELISSLTWLFDVLIAGALLTAILRGFLKKFWNMTWKLIVFTGLFAALVIFSAQLAPLIGNLGFGIEVTVNGTDYQTETLYQTLDIIARLGGQSTADSQEFAMRVLQNLVVMVGILPVMIVATIVSLATFPLINLAIPKRVKKLKMRIPSFFLSLVYFFLTLFLFASAAHNVFSPLVAIRDSAAFNDQSLLAAVFKPELIDVLGLFTRKNSYILRIIDFGNITNYQMFFQKIGESGKFIDIYEALLAELNLIIPTS